MVMTLVELNVLEICAGDIHNPYLEAFTKEKWHMLLEQSVDHR